MARGFFLGDFRTPAGARNSSRLPTVRYCVIQTKCGHFANECRDGRPKACWIEVDEELSGEELRYLRADIYRWDEAEPLTLFLTAQDRFRA